MEIKDINFASLETVTKRCVTFARDGNTVVKPYKKLYPVKHITSDSKHKNLFLEAVQKGFYILWEQLTDFCVKVGSFQEHKTIEAFTEVLSNYKFFGIDGFLNFLEETEKIGRFINLVDIEVCRMLKRPELAIHYTEYRENFIQKREAKEAAKQAEIEQEEQERKEREAAEREKRLREAEDTLRNKQTLYNKKFSQSTSIVLALMRRYSIEVPLRTQGWINKALHSICFSNGKISYQYYSSSSDSKVFKQYLSTLEEKVINGEEN